MRSCGKPLLLFVSQDRLVPRVCFAVCFCRPVDHLEASVLSLAPVVTDVLGETLSGDHAPTRSHNLTLLLFSAINDQFDLVTRQHRFQSLSPGIL